MGSKKGDLRHLAWAIDQGTRALSAGVSAGHSAPMS